MASLPLLLVDTICLCRYCSGQAVMKWHKMGIGDVQVLPYLILTIDDGVACPVRICDLSEKQRYPIVFSNCKKDNERLPCVFMTAQQCDGQVFLTLWDERIPQITIHNMSQLSLNVIASRSENGRYRTTAEAKMMWEDWRVCFRNVFIYRKWSYFLLRGLELEVSSARQVLGAFPYTKPELGEDEETVKRVSHVRGRE